MKNKILLALILVLLFPVHAKSASKDPELPNIEIVNPMNGQTVEGTVKVVVDAEGVGLRNPYLTIEGEHVGTQVVMDDCVSSVEKEGKLERMSCTYKWDTTSFKGEKVRLIAEVKDSTGYDTDEVAVRVSGHKNKTGNSFLNYECNHP
jgi:hypothetical protein